MDLVLIVASETLLGVMNQLVLSITRDHLLAIQALHSVHREAVSGMVHLSEEADQREEVPQTAVLYSEDTDR